MARGEHRTDRSYRRNRSAFDVGRAERVREIIQATQLLITKYARHCQDAVIDDATSIELHSQLTDIHLVLQDIGYTFVVRLSGCRTDADPLSCHSLHTLWLS